MSHPSAEATVGRRVARRKRPPGPPSYAFFRWLRDLRRDPLQLFEGMHRRYGDIACVRVLHRHFYSFARPEHVKHVLQDRHAIYNKDNIDYRTLKPVFGEGLLTSNGDLWLRQRRLIQPAFHRERVESIAALITERTGLLLEGWRRDVERGEPVDVTREMARLTLDIATHSLFGVEMGARAREIERAVLTLGRAVMDRLSSMLAFLPFLPTPGNRRAWEAVRSLKQIVKGIIDERRGSSVDTGDLLSMLLLARDEETGEAMSDRQLRDEVMTLLLAGHETTANALGWTWYLLSANPDVAVRLHREASEVLGGRTPTIGDLPRLGYARMVLEEAMRLYPPAWFISRAALEEDEIGGYRIPRRSIVGLCPWVIHRHPDLWEDPERFDPERFAPERSAGRPRFAYFPFGGGPRLCIGKTFAMTEAHLILVMISQRYRLETVPGHPVEPEPLVTLRPRYGLPMTVTPL